MISWFLSKNSTRTTSTDELIHIIVQNKDLMYKEGVTNIGGINLYHYRDNNNAAIFSYGSVCLSLTRLASSIGRLDVGMSSIGKNNDLFYFRINDEYICMNSKVNINEDIPLSAFESEVDFFQYTLLNLKYECSDASLLKLIKFIMEFLNEQSK